MKNNRIYPLACLLSTAALLYVPFPGFAAGPILGSAETFAVLAGSTVTNTGATLIKGNLGVSPGTAITGFPPGILLIGTIHAADAVAAQAQVDLATAYNTLAAKPCTVNLTGKDLGGLTLTSAVYCFDTSAQLTGTLVLDFQGSTKGFVFQIGSTLTTASSSSVMVKNCSMHCPIEWQVGSSATLGTTTAFQGNIIALSSITLNHAATILCGRALARNGAVTLDTNEVFFMGTLTPPATTVTGNGQIPVPNPNSSEPDVSGTGRAGFAFIADPKGNGSILNYFNYVTGLHVYGLVTKFEVTAVNPDGSPKTIRFSGACHSSLPACSFSGTVAQHKQPDGADEFGITVTGGLPEARSQRLISSGRIQFQ